MIRKNNSPSVNRAFTLGRVVGRERHHWHTGGASYGLLFKQRVNLHEDRNAQMNLKQIGLACLNRT